MHLAVIETRTTPVVDEFAERLASLNLLRYASEAVQEMEFDSLQELNGSVARAIEIVQAAGIPMKGNFLRVYKSYAEGIAYDWKLSPMAYQLVCICGNPGNPNVARTIVQLIKQQHSFK